MQSLYLIQALKWWRQETGRWNWQSSYSTLEELADATCPVFNGHVLACWSSGTTWDDAKAYCESVGGHLATSTSPEKNQLLRRLLASRTFNTNSNAWLGMTRGATGSFEWITGEPVDYTNFESGEPNNDRGNEDSVELYNKDSATWNDQSRTEGRSFLVEWDSLEDFCNRNFYYYAGHTYTVLVKPDGIEYDPAKALCTSTGGHLVAILNEGMNTFITSIMQAESCPITWIGLEGTNEDDPSDYLWVTGQQVVYTNWEVKPKRAPFGVELRQIDGTWKAYYAGVSGVICEWDRDLRKPSPTKLITKAVFESPKNLPAGLTLTVKNNDPFIEGTPLEEGTTLVPILVKTNYGEDSSEIKIISSKIELEGE